LIDDAKHALAVFSQPYLHCEIAVAFDEASRAVKRINHPNALLVETSTCIN
jgi:hypothetical protein